MRTTVEGVEALDELALVREKGVDYIQGYLFSKPLTQDKILEKQGSGEWVLEAKGPSRNRAQRLSVLRKIGVIHGDYRYEVRMRNLSRTGAMIEGVSDVPVGTELVLDLGEGQLAVATVRRSEGDVQGVEFETGLVNDGADGLCTRFRISPYALAAAGMPLQALPPECRAWKTAWSKKFGPAARLNHSLRCFESTKKNTQAWKTWSFTGPRGCLGWNSKSN